MGEIVIEVLEDNMSKSPELLLSLFPLLDRWESSLKSKNTFLGVYLLKMRHLQTRWHHR